MIEVATIPSGVIPQNATDKVMQASRQEIERIGDVAQQVAESIIVKMKQMLTPPSEFQLEFGVNASGEAGLPLVTKGTLAANFKVTLTWKKEK